MKINIEKLGFPICQEAKDYYNTKATFKQAWQECQRGDWMLCFADNIGVDPSTLTIAYRANDNVHDYVNANKGYYSSEAYYDSQDYVKIQKETADIFRDILTEKVFKKLEITTNEN